MDDRFFTQPTLNSPYEFPGRHHPFSGYRPFFRQVEAVETAIWLTEVAPTGSRSSGQSSSSWPAPTRRPTAI
jgi:hypothetical protein